MISRKTLLTTIVISGVLGTSLMGCSSMVESTRKSLLGDSSPRKNNKEVKWVSKTQYDELMDKYKHLSSKYENLKDTQIKNRSGFDQIDSMIDPSHDSNTETIDVFSKDNKKALVKQTSEKSISTDLDFYNKGLTLLQNKKTDEALKVFQFLQKSQVKQVQVRAKQHIGNIYLNKKQYDLALQVYEGIIHNNSYSGIVIKALEKASICSGHLGLKGKKAQYDSILKDFFEVRV